MRDPTSLSDALHMVQSRMCSPDYDGTVGWLDISIKPDEAVLFEMEEAIETVKDLKQRLRYVSKKKSKQELEQAAHKRWSAKRQERERQEAERLALKYERDVVRSSIFEVPVAPGEFTSTLDERMAKRVFSYLERIPSRFEIDMCSVRRFHLRDYSNGCGIRIEFENGQMTSEI